VGFRDEQKAIRARLDALERQNAELREALATRQEAASAEERARLDALARENVALRARLAAERPDVGARLGELSGALNARVRRLLPAPAEVAPGEPTARALRRLWRFQAPVVAGRRLLGRHGPDPRHGGAQLVMAFAAFTAGGDVIFSRVVQPYVTLLGVLLLRVVPVGFASLFALPWLVLLALPGPQYLLCGLFCVAFPPPQAQLLVAPGTFDWNAPARP
jgi:hypothetical protein